MAITFIALLVVAGLFFGGLITMILLAVNAKTTGGRVAVLATGFVLLFGVPLAMVMVSFVTVRTTTTETGPVDIAYDEPHEIVEEWNGVRGRSPRRPEALRHASGRAPRHRFLRQPRFRAPSIRPSRIIGTRMRKEHLQQASIRAFRQLSNRSSRGLIKR